MYKMTHKTGHLKIAFAFSLNVIAIKCNVHPLTPSVVMSFSFAKRGSVVTF